MQAATVRFLTALFLVAAVARSGENWPQFRGPTGLSLSDEKDLPLTWGGAAASNILWKSPLKGEAHASPVVWGGKVFVTAVSWPMGVKREDNFPEHHVTCYSAEDGKELWTAALAPGPWKLKDFRNGGGTYAAPTPAVDSRGVFCMFGSSVVAAFDLDGKPLWRKEVVPFTFDVTVGSSPIIVGDTLIILCDMAKKQDSRIFAMDLRTGETKWESKRPEASFSHTTPTLITVAGKQQLLVAGSGVLQALNPADGAVIWSCKSKGDAASPGFGSGIVYSDSGRGGPGVAVDPTGTGDVTKTHVKWTIAQVPEGLGSPIILGEYVYRLHSPAVLRCWKVSDGSLVYAERVPLASTWFTPFADAAGNLYFANSGKSVVVRGGPKFEVLGSSDLGDPSHASAAVAGGRIFLKGSKFLFCVGNKK